MQRGSTCIMTRHHEAHSATAFNPLDANRTYMHDPLYLAIPALEIKHPTMDIMCDFVGTASRFEWDCTSGKDPNNMPYYDTVPSRAEACKGHAIGVQRMQQQRTTERSEHSAAGPRARRRALVPPLPIVDEEYFEWAGILEAIAAAEGTFTVVELGARWGTWTLRALVAARLLRPELKLQGALMEPQPSYFEWATEAVRLNGFEGQVHLSRNLSTPQSVIELLRRYERVDLLDMDIQGAEGGEIRCQHTLTRQHTLWTSQGATHLPTYTPMDTR